MILKRNYFNYIKSFRWTYIFIAHNLFVYCRLPYITKNRLHSNLRRYLEENLCLSSLPVSLFSDHSSTNAFAAFLLTFLSEQNNHHDTHHKHGKRRWEKVLGRHDQYCCGKTSDSLFWDHRGKFSEGLCSDRETRQMCSEQDIQLSGSWWSPSYRSSGADACTALCRTAETQREGTWLTYTKGTDVSNFILVDWRQVLSSPWASWSHWVWCSV